MKLRTLAASTAALAFALSGAPLLAAGNNPDANPPLDMTSLLNQANQMNHEEIDAANTALNKDGNNLAIKSFANTMKEDHKVNQNAVEALANKENISLSDYHKPAEDKNLSNMNGMAFTNQFLQDQIQDHQKAIQQFESARNEVTNPHVKMYIDETLPVLQAHLKTAQNLQRDMHGMSNPNNNNEQTSER
jgi:putative membrane protein